MQIHLRNTKLNRKFSLGWTHLRNVHYLPTSSSHHHHLSFPYIYLPSTMKVKQILITHINIKYPCRWTTFLISQILPWDDQSMAGRTTTANPCRDTDTEQSQGSAEHPMMMMLRRKEELNNQATPLGIPFYYANKKVTAQGTCYLFARKGCEFSKLQIKLVITFNYD